jgi:hypothetical protein
MIRLASAVSTASSSQPMERSADTAIFSRLLY